MIFYILTAVLFLVKILGYSDISWWLVAAPALFAIGLLVVFGGLAAWLITWSNK